MSYDGVTWIPLDEYRKGDLVPGASSDCSSPTPTIYRWVQTENTVCVENQDTTYTKYYVYKKQQQVNGQWVDVYPLETKPDGNPLGTYRTLAECEGRMKYKAIYTDGYEFVYECNTSTTLTQSEFREAPDRGMPVAEYVVGDCVTTIGSDLVGGNLCSAITLSNSVTTFENYALWSSHLKSVTVPSGVTSISYGCFFGCEELESVVLPNGLTNIDHYAFRECKSLTGITIPNNVTTIGRESFIYCSGLTSVTIPASVTSIYNLAFRYCTNLESITILAETPPSPLIYQWDVWEAFDDTNDCPIYVPAASVNAYKTASGWSNYSSRIQAIP